MLFRTLIAAPFPLQLYQIFARGRGETRKNKAMVVVPYAGSGKHLPFQYDHRREEGQSIATNWLGWNYVG
jgi:hypothetical protein